jgi:hypothetical protein
LTRLAALGTKHRHVAKVDQGIQAWVGYEDYVTTFATVAPIGTTAGYKLLAPETQASIASATGLHSKGRFIDKLHGSMEER